MMTDMPYALHAEGLLQAVHGVSRLGIPIYITETGVADAGDSVRPQFIQSYMAAIEEAVRIGYNLRGVMYWTLVDNFEWAFGYRMMFGMYLWKPTPDGNQERKLHPSAALLKEWYARLVERCPGHRWEAVALEAKKKLGSEIEEDGSEIQGEKKVLLGGAF